MPDAAPSPPHEVAFRAYGVAARIGVPTPELVGRVQAILPPGWQPSEPGEGDHQLALTARDGINYRIAFEGGSVAGSAEVEVALDVLATRVRACVALNAPNHIFVHAGVVGHAGRAIVIPGTTFSGKTTLVAELVRAGAHYYSDEYAVLDASGRVHPYPKPLSIRTTGREQTDYDVATLMGGKTGEEPLQTGLIVVAEYRPDVAWQPRRLSSGEAALALLANTVAAQVRPKPALEAISRAIEGAVALEGERGEAASIAGKLLDTVAGV